MGTDSWFSRVWRAPRKKNSSENEKVLIRVLAFEVASLMSKVVVLWQSLGDDQIIKLRDEIMYSEGVRKLVSDDHDFLLWLAIAEMFDNLGFVVRAVARLGKRCSDPVLRGLEALFDDLVKNVGAADTFGWEFTWKKMGRKVKKMERFVAASGNLYQEMEVLAELEQGLRRMKASEGDPNRGNLLDLQQRVVWQRQEVKSIRDSSLWNRSYDYTIRLMVRSLFTIYGRMKHVFGIDHPIAVANSGAAVTGDARVLNSLPRSHSISSLLQSSVHPAENSEPRFASGPLGRLTGTQSGPLYSASGQLRLKTRRSGTGSHPFRGCMTGGGGNESPVLHGCKPIGVSFPKSNGVVSGILKEPSEVHSSHSKILNLNRSFFTSKNRLLSNPPPSTLGEASLALHYANVIIVIEKFATCPHLIAPDARDDLYNMLPTSIRAALRTRLKSYSKNLKTASYDAVLAAEWNDALGRILEWLAPLAHNMIRWQSERTFEQQHWVSRTNVLLLQTLYYANQAKTEAAITELLVGLNYICRFQGELHQKAILEAAGSMDFGDYLDVHG